jgi:hypothetical protein
MKKRTLLLIIIALSTITAFAQNVPSYVPSNGLVGWWPFNGNANDESGNGNNGIINAGGSGLQPTLTNDRNNIPNSAYSFPGSGAHMTLPATNINNIVNCFSYSLWLKQNFINDFLCFIDPTYSGKIGMLSPNSSGLRAYDGNSFFIDAITPSISNNDWKNITIIYFNQNISIYINGVLIIQSTAQTQMTYVNGQTKLGNYSGSIYSYQGLMDDIGIWNRALTECEIQDLYHAQLGSQAISAGLDQSICAGDNVTLNGSGGSNYLWNNNVIDGQAFAPTQSNAYVVNGTDTLGCQGTDTVAVTVLENATSSLTQTALDSYTLNGQTYTQSGTYTQTVPAANGCDSIITLNLSLNFTGIDELGTGAKKLLKITDLNGKIIPRRKNTLMLFIYEDGTVERLVEMEE